MPKPKPQKRPSRQELLEMLRRALSNCRHRRRVHDSVPRRGKTHVDRVKRYEYTIQTNGVADLLQGVTQGRLEPITDDMLSALIGELSSAFANERE